MSRRIGAPWKWVGRTLYAKNRDGNLEEVVSICGIHDRNERLSLIAAAPELLEALKQCLALSEYVRREEGEGYSHDVGWTKIEEVIDDAREAIKKAKGGKQ